MLNDWQETGVVQLSGISEDKHTLYILTRYEGGNIINEDSINFYVLITGYKPHFNDSADTLLFSDTGKPLTISPSLTGEKPFNYVWLKDDTVITDVTDSVLNFSSFLLSDTGKYSCIASNVYGIDTSRVFQISFKQTIDTTKDTASDTTYFTISIQNTVGGKVIGLVKEKYLLNEQISLKAVPDSGYEFDYWDGDITENDTELNVTISKDLTIRAVFTPIISSECTTLEQGRNVTSAINEIITGKRQGVLCVSSGVYNSGAVRVNGNLRIYVK